MTDLIKKWRAIQANIMFRWCAHVSCDYCLTKKRRIMFCLNILYSLYIFNSSVTMASYGIRQL